MDNQTSQAKILFVSNTFGTTVSEVLIFTCLTILCYTVYCIIQYAAKKNEKTVEETSSSFLSFLKDQLFLVLPLLLGLTVLSDYLLLLNVLFFVIVLVLFQQNAHGKYKEYFIIFRHCINSESEFLIHYKALIQIVTCICILAVDFHIFPRRFAKVEVYGIGMMDMGVGCIIFSTALTSAPARSKRKIAFRQVFKNLNTSLILMCFGFLRVLLVKLSNYQVHISEYGVHWNFFFTLAVVRTAGILILYLLPWFQKQPIYLLLSALIITIYQYSLSNMGLKDIIENGFHGNNSRSSFFDSNREGIVSCIGYTSLYFLGLFFGSQLFKMKLSSFSKLCWLGLWFLAGFVCLNLSIVYVVPISRKMVNISYYFMQIVFNALLLFGLLGTDILMQSFRTLDRKDDKFLNFNCASFLSCAISRNLLIYFLFGNVLTGLVNFSVRTLEVGNFLAMVVLAAYMLTLNSLIWIVYIYQN